VNHPVNAHLLFDEESSQEEVELVATPPQSPPSMVVAPVVVDENPIVHLRALLHSPFVPIRGLPPAYQTLFKRLIKLLLATLLEKVDTGADSEEAILAFLLAPIIIGRTISKRGGVAATTSIRNVLKRIMGSADPYLSFVVELTATPLKEYHNPASSPSGDTSEQINKKTIDRMTTLAQKNRLSKALGLLESKVRGDKMATREDAALALPQLFPPRSDQDALPAPTAEWESIQLDEDTIEHSIQSLPRESATGFSGWSYELVQVLIQGEDSSLGLITQLFNRLLADRVPYPNLWLSSKVVPILKPNKSIRPIVVSDIWTRILSRIVASSLATAAQEHLAPLQLGVGVSGACEIISHAAQLYIASPLDRCLLNVDFRNAFNSIHRHSIFEELEDSFPNLRRFFHFAYSMPSPLYLDSGDYIGECGTGVRQGDPLGPLYFALGLQRVLRHLRSSSFQCTILAYLDDVLVLAPRNQCIHAYSVLRSKAADVGLRVNASKSVLYTKDLTPPVLEDPPQLITDGLKILGSPVGTEDYVKNSLRERFDTRDTPVLSIIPELPATLGLQLVRSCVNARPLFLARAILPLILQEPAEHFDAAVDRCIGKLIGCNFEFPPESQLARHLPAHLGGLGIRRLACLIPQYISSFLLFVKWMQPKHPPLFRLLMNPSPLRNASIAYFKRSPITNPLIVDNDAEPGQTPFINVDEIDPQITSKAITEPDDLRLQQDLIGLLHHSHDRLAWYRSQAARGTLLWLHAASSSIPLFHMSRDAFEGAMRLRLLLPLPALLPGQARRCACGEVLNPENDWGYHALTCNSNVPIKTARHHSICKAVCHFLNGVGYRQSVSREVTINVGENTRIADIRYTKDGDHFLDVTVINPAALRFLARGSHTALGVASHIKYEEKMAHYSVLGEAYLGRIHPIVMELSSRVEMRSLAWIDDISGMNGLLQRPDPAKKRARLFLLKNISYHLALFTGRSIRHYLDTASVVSL